MWYSGNGEMKPRGPDESLKLAASAARPERRQAQLYLADTIAAHFPCENS
jgi:hypothetical protein